MTNYLNLTEEELLAEMETQDAVITEEAKKLPENEAEYRELLAARKELADALAKKRSE